MQKNHLIYIIISKLLLGTLEKEDSQELDSWLSATDRNKLLLKSFLERRDLSVLFDIKVRS